MTPALHEPDPEGTLRVFVAAHLPPDVRAAVVAVQDRLRRTGARVSWTRKENIHLTLVFLGDLTPKRTAAARDILEETCSLCPPFACAAAGVGAFGSPRRPRIIWAGIHDPPDALFALQGTLTERLAQKGFAVERRAFTPHVTIGRVRGAAGVDALTSALASAKNTAFGTVPVQRVFLMQSHLESQGVRYTVYHESELKGNRDHGR